MKNRCKGRKQMLLSLMFCLIFFLFGGMMGINVWAESDEGSTEVSTEEGRSEEADLLEGWSSYVKWIDNGNAYETRPMSAAVSDEFTVKRYTESQGISNAETLGTGTAYELTAQPDSDGNSWKITLSKAVAKNSDGEEYIYFLVQKDAVSTASTKGNYQTTYKNSGDFVYETNALFNGGTLSNQLKGKVTFSVTTTWQDGKTEDSENRPVMTMSLYRVVEDSQKAIVAADIAKAVEVKKVTVAKTDGSLDFGSDLEAFDSRGHRYVYFALEKGSAEDYETLIDNSTSSESEAIQTIFADIKANGQVKYILNGGTLINQRGATQKVEAVATFKADSMKSELANSYVIYQLQYKTDEDGSDWQNLTGDAEGKCALIASYDEETTTISEQGVFLKLSGFSKNKTTVINDSLLCQKYDANSHVISYRFVEVKMSMDGKTEINVSSWPESDGSIPYDMVKVGNVAPGVGDGKTTAYFELEQSGNTVTHTLTAATQIEITNQWFDSDDRNISGDTGEDDQLDSVYTSYYIVRSDGASTKNGTLLDLDGSRVGSIYGGVFINGSNLNGAKTHWITTIDKLPRFDGSGREYTYTVEPIVNQNSGNAAFDPHGVQWTETSHTICSVEAIDGDNISKVCAQYVYSQNTNQQLSYTIDARWKDDSNLSSRREIKYELRNIDTGNKVSEGTLSAANGWHDVLYFDRNNDEDTIDNFVILVTDIGGVQVDYSRFSTDGMIDYDSILGFENAQFGQNSNYNSSASITKIEENDNSQLTDHYYNIFIDRSGKDLKSAAVTITNQRQAKDTLTLEQTWATGKDCPGVTYQLLRNGESLAWANYSCGDSQKHADNDGKFTLTGNASMTNGLYSQTASFTVDKYDIDGKEYNYEFKAVSLNKDNTTYSLSDGKAVIDGTNYEEQFYYDEEASTMVGAQKHNNGSNYVWKGALTKRDLVNLNAHLVWRDNGNTERPEVSFNVYRVSLADYTNLADLIKENKTADLVNAIKTIGATGTPVTCDMDWDQVNGWYQSAHLASLPRFDLNGYEYVYYLMETTNVVDGDYQTFYSNLTSETNGYLPSTSENANDSKDVYAVEEQDFDGSGSLTILADGIHSKDGDFGAYYAGTVVNKIKKTRIISGKNTYQLPEGMSMPKYTLPSVTIKLYQTLNKAEFNGNYTQKELKEFLQSKYIGEDQIVETMSLSCESAGAFRKAGSIGYTFTFGVGSVTLDEYDEFGREYHYYIMEDNLENYPDDKIVTDEATFSMVNTYAFQDHYVEIPIKKTWVKDSSIEKTLNAPAHFKLYARMQDNEGTPFDEIYLMAQTTLVPDENAKAEYTFTAYSEGTGDNKNAKLTYMAPNEQPWAYFVEEEGIDGYEEAVKIDGSWNTGSATEPVRVTIPTPSSNTAVTAIEYQNTYTPGTTSFDVEAKWVDGDSSDVDNSTFRPSSVTMEIYHRWNGNSTAPEDSAAASGGDELYASYDLSSENSWKVSVSDAPKYAENGMEYSYYLKSQTGSDEGDINKLSHYSSNISQTDFSVTNTLKVTSLSYSLDWQWYQDNGVTGKTMTKDVYQMLQDFEVLPSSITTYVQRKTNQDAEWEFVPAKSGSSKKLSHPNGNTEQVLGIKLVLTKATTFTEFTKGISGISFSDLPQYKPDTTDNIQYKYRVVECLTWADGNNRWWFDTDASNNDVLEPQESQFAAMTAMKLDKTINKIPTQTITNYINMVSTVLEKKWNDDGNIYNTRPETIKFTVKKAGSTTASHDFVLSGSSQSGNNVYSSGTVYLPKAANDGGSEQMNAAYSVTEERTEGSTGLVAAGGNGIYESDSTQEVKFDKQGTSKAFTYSITNVLKNHTRPTTNYNASVSFADASLGTDMINMIRPVSVRVTLYYKASDGKYYPVKDAGEADKTAAGGFVITESTADLATYTVKDLSISVSTAGAEGSHNFTNLSKYWALDENSAGNRKEIEYAVKEEFLDDNGNVINASYTSDASTPAADGSMLSTGAITNTPDLAVQLIISKIWKYSDRSDMAEDQVNTLIQKGYLPETIRYTLTENSQAGDFSEAQTQDITVANLFMGDVNWTKQYPKYDKNGNQIVYTVTETGYKFRESNDYVTSVYGLSTSPVTIPTTDGYTAKLESIYQITGVTANISWKDQNNAFGLRPSKVFVSVKISGESDGITDGDISESDGWSNTFNYLPKYSVNGEEIQYTLDANTVAGYQVASIENGVITYTFAGTELTLYDIWKYSNGETITEANINSLIEKNSIPKTLNLELTAQYKGSDGNDFNLKQTQSVDVANAVKNGVKWNVKLPEKDADGDDISYVISLKSATYKDETEKNAPIEGITFTASTPAKTDGSYQASLENTYALNHTWTYAASGASLTASCKGECDTEAIHKATLTLSADDKPYSGQTVTASYGSGQEETWKSMTGLDAPAISYQSKDGENWTDLEQAPSDVGNYRAVAKVTQDSTTYTAAVEFAIIHVHVFAEEWTNDADYHWHPCSGNGATSDCKEAEGSQKASHSWNAGQVTKQASETAEGEKTYTCTVCQKTKTEQISKLGHEKGTYHQPVAATCAASGTVEYWECKNCEGKLDGSGNLLSSIETAKNPSNHVGGAELIGKVDPTCAVTGYTGDVYCKGCNTKLADGSTIPVSGNHGSTETRKYKAPTCAEAGYTGDIYCTVCNQKLSDGSTIPVSGNHGPTETRKYKAPTCVEAGYTGDIYCTVCNQKLSSGSTIEATGQHAWNDVQVTKEASEIEEGQKTYTCTVCQKTKTEPIAKLVHEKDTHHQAVQATCRATGTVEYWECKNCDKNLDADGKVISNIVVAKDPANHAGGSEVKNAKAATCGQAGYTGDSYCKGCNNKLAGGSTIAATGKHRWDAGKVTKEATYDATGVKTYTCTICGQTKTEIIAKKEYVAPKASAKNAAATELNSKLKMSQTNGKVTVEWGRVTGATSYDVYINYCGYDAKYVKNVKGTKLAVSKLFGHSVNKTSNFKGYVIAKKGNQELVKSIVVHAAGEQSEKFTNAKRIKVQKTTLTIKLNKSATIKATTVLEKKGKKELTHSDAYRFKSSNRKIATVSSTGKVNAIAKGTCWIYIFANNGVSAKVKVTVTA